MSTSIIRFRLAGAIIMGMLIMLSCATQNPRPPADPAIGSIDQVAEDYTKLVLHFGEHDDGYVDAYHGPGEWREEAQANTKSLSQIKLEAEAQLTKLAKEEAPTGDELETLRHEFLIAQLRALIARVEMIEGKKFAFDEESQALYNAVSPSYPASHYEEILAQLDSLVPGAGPLTERINAFRDQFIIPLDSLEKVFTTAIKEARRRTLAAMELPDNENFRLEFVTDQAWSAYNWYQGNFQSLIQVDTDLPIYIHRAIDLASHEGYPGHHVYNVMLEQHLVNERGWVEFSVYPLYSPLALIAEGTANYGIDVAFPGEERIRYEKEVLFPLAGLDSAQAGKYYQVLALKKKLAYASNEAARGYLDGTMTADEAVVWLIQYSLSSPERARKFLRFVDIYRSYVINYNLGQDMVRSWVESQGGTDDNPQWRWEIFQQLLSSPRLASGLR
ncbi:MAG: hypothetical protein V3W14_05665 [Candidatus Neomarinimicrobiota bacterium]